MADGTITIPKIGEVKKVYVYGAGGSVAAYVLYRYWSASRAAAAAAVAPPPESAGTIGADISSGAGGYDNPNGDGIGGSTTIGDVLSTDAQWSEKALVALENAGFDTGAASIALGKYLRSEPLTSAEANMIRVALAFAGTPPSGAKAIVGGGDAPTPSALTAPQNVRSAGTPTSAAIPFQWDPVAGASQYAIYRGSTELARVSGTSYTATGLQPATQYGHAVKAVNSGGSMSSISRAYVTKTAAAAAPAPTPTKPAPKPTGGVPAHRSIYITPAARTLSAAVAADNKRYHVNHRWEDVWAFNLRYRDPSTAAKLRARGSGKVFIGSMFWIPK